MAPSAARSEIRVYGRIYILDHPDVASLRQFGRILDTNIGRTGVQGAVRVAAEGLQGGVDPDGGYGDRDRRRRG